MWIHFSIITFALVPKMLFEMEEYEGDLDYRSIAVSTRTPCKDVLPLIIKKYDLPGNVEEYQLMEVSEDNEGKDKTDLLTQVQIDLLLQLGSLVVGHRFVVLESINWVYELRRRCLARLTHRWNWDCASWVFSAEGRKLEKPKKTP